MTLAREKPSSAIDEGAVRRPQDFNRKLAVVIDDASVSSRDLRFGIVFIQIDVRKNTAVGVPTSVVRFDSGYRKLFTDSAAALDYEPCQRVALWVVSVEVAGLLCGRSGKP